MVAAIMKTARYAYTLETSRARIRCSRNCKAGTGCNKYGEGGSHESRADMPRTTSCSLHRRIDVPAWTLSAEIDLEEAQDGNHVVLLVVHLQLLQSGL